MAIPNTTITTPTAIPATAPVDNPFPPPTTSPPPVTPHPVPSGPGDLVTVVLTVTVPISNPLILGNAAAPSTNHPLATSRLGHAGGVCVAVATSTPPLPLTLAATPPKRLLNTPNCGAIPSGVPFPADPAGYFTTPYCDCPSRIAHSNTLTPANTSLNPSCPSNTPTSLKFLAAPGRVSDALHPASDTTTGIPNPRPANSPRREVNDCVLQEEGRKRFNPRRSMEASGEELAGRQVR